MTTKHKKALLLDHIPYRMSAVSGMCWACEDPSRLTRYHSIHVVGDGHKLACGASLHFMTNPLIDSGAVFARALLEFLGLTFDRRHYRLRQIRSRRKSDIGIEHFGLDRVSCRDLAAAPLGVPRTDIIAGCVTVVVIAHRAVAHLSSRGPREPKPDRLFVGGSAILWALEEHLYRKLGCDLPNYKHWIAA